MMWTLLPLGLVAILVVGILVSDFLACRSVRICKGRLTGEAPKEKCLKGSESFAMMDEHRTMSLLSPGGARIAKVAAPGDAQIVSMNRWSREHI
jgi:hypothetical protein